MSETYAMRHRSSRLLFIWWMAAKTPVKHRELMAISPSGRTIVVYQTDDTSNIIDLLLVTDLEVKNGEAPQRRRK
jgi:hypothetical protein